MPIGILPNIINIVNEEHLNQSSHWHNIFEQIRSFINFGQPIGKSQEVTLTNGIIIPSSIKNSTIRVKGSGEPITTDIMTQGFDGQEIKLEGTDNINTLTIQSSGIFQLQGGNSCALGEGDILAVHYNKNRNKWIENYRSINN